MTTRRRFAFGLPLSLVLLGAGAALAQTSKPAQEAVLKEGRFNEDDLVRQLDDTPTRSWTPQVAGSTAAVAAPAPGRASILITFATASAELTPQARQSLDVLAAAMKHSRLAERSFTIEGHADPRGGDELNRQLSQARAESVRAYLTAQHGLAAERLAAVGKGSRELMNPGQPAAPENRRVTIVTQPKR